MSVEEKLQEAQDVFAERNAIYGNSYLRTGDIMKGFFPNGLNLVTEDDHIRFSMFRMCITKLNRYAVNLTSGGHMDSAIDLINYAAILAEVTEDD